MLVSIQRAELLKVLGHVQGVVGKRSTVPILDNVLIAAEGGRLTLSATDLELSIVEGTEAAIGRKGSCTAPAATLYDIVRKMPDDAKLEMDGTGNDQTLKIKAGRYSTKLVTLPVEDYPSTSMGDLPHSFKLAAYELRRLIDRTRFAISSEATRYYLCGMYLHEPKTDASPTLRAVSTDGHRLARIDCALPANADGMPGVIIPTKAIAELRRLIDKFDGEIGVALSDTRIQFKIGDVLLASKLIDGSFPDYERVIPSGLDKTLRIAEQPFSAAINRVAAVGAERDRPVKLSMSREAFEVSGTYSDRGSAREILDAEYTGAQMEIGFQARYLNDIAEQMAGDIEFHFGDSASPAVIKDTADAGTLYVLMPMRV